MKKGEVVDQIVALDKEIKALSDKQKELKEILKKSGAGVYSGSNHVATVSQVERKTLDMAAVREKLSAQFIRAHTNVSCYFTIKLKAAA